MLLHNRLLTIRLAFIDNFSIFIENSIYRGYLSENKSIFRMRY